MKTNGTPGGSSTIRIRGTNSLNANRIILNFGKVGATYYIDNIKFGLAKDQCTATRGIQYVLARNGKARRDTRAGSKMYYVLKTPAEKQAALEAAMDTWVSGVANHLKEKNVVPFGYDVINEPIADGSNGRRGYDGVFGTRRTMFLLP